MGGGTSGIFLTEIVRTQVAPNVFDFSITATLQEVKDALADGKIVVAKETSTSSNTSVTSYAYLGTMIEGSDGVDLNFIAHSGTEVVSFTIEMDEASAQ